MAYHVRRQIAGGIAFQAFLADHWQDGAQTLAAVAVVGAIDFKTRYINSLLLLIDLPCKVRTLMTGDGGPADESLTAVTITLYSLSAIRFCSITSVCLPLTVTWTRVTLTASNKFVEICVL